MRSQKIDDYCKISWQKLKTDDYFNKKSPFLDYENSRAKKSLFFPKNGLFLHFLGKSDPRDEKSYPPPEKISLLSKI